MGYLKQLLPGRSRRFFKLRRQFTAQSAADWPYSATAGSVWIAQTKTTPAIDASNEGVQSAEAVFTLCPNQLYSTNQISE